LRAGLPSELDRIVLRALERDPGQRYQTAREMRRDLEGLMHGPPVRLDEYMRELFGEERARQRLDIREVADDAPTALASIPVLVEQPTSSPAIPGAADSLDEAPTVQQSRMSARASAAAGGSAEVATPAPTPPPLTAGAGTAAGTGTAVPRSSRPPWMLTGLLLLILLTGAALGSSWFLFARGSSELDRAMALAQSGEHERARMLLDTYLVENPDDPDALVLRLLVQWWTTAPHIEAAVERARAGPLDPEQRVLVEGIVLVNAGRNTEAVAELEPIVAASPGRAEILYALGEALWHGQRYREGADMLARAVAADGRWEMALHHPVDFFLDRKELDRVETLAALVATTNPVKAAELRALVAFGDRRYDEALELITAKLGAHPDEARLWTVLGETYTVSEEVRRGRSAEKKAFELSPVDDRDDGATAHLAEFHLYRGELHEFRRVSGAAAPTRGLVRALWHRPMGSSPDRPSPKGLLTPTIWVGTYLEVAHWDGRDERGMWELYPEPDVRALGEALDHESKEAWSAAAAAYDRGLAAECSGELRMLLSHHLARVRRKLGDVTGAAEICAEVIWPRRYETYRALLIPDCSLWTGDAATDPATAMEWYRRTAAPWLETKFVHPSVVEARTRLGE